MTKPTKTARHRQRQLETSEKRQKRQAIRNTRGAYSSQFWEPFYLTLTPMHASLHRGLIQQNKTKAFLNL